MFKNKRIVGAVEYGTSKLTVLIGEIDTNDNLTIIGNAGKNLTRADRYIGKGEILDLAKVQAELRELLEKINEETDGKINDVQKWAVLVSGKDIVAERQHSSISSSDKLLSVTRDDCDKIYERATATRIPEGRELINSVLSYWCVNGRRVPNPLQMSCEKLEVAVIAVQAHKSTLENFKIPLINSGFERESIVPIFSPLASASHIISSREFSSGALMIDLGAGCTEYAVTGGADGILVAGVLPVGFDNVINDMAVAFQLPFEVVQKLFEMGIVQEKIYENNKPQLNMRLHSTKKMYNIPAGSIKTVISLRLTEIFSIIRDRLAKENIFARDFGAGCVLTGGGALFAPSLDYLKSVFEVACRVGAPPDISWAKIGEVAPQYSAISGALHFAADMLGDDGNPGLFDSMVEKIRGFVGGSINGNDKEGK